MNLTYNRSYQNLTKTTQLITPIYNLTKTVPSLNNIKGLKINLKRFCTKKVFISSKNTANFHVIHNNKEHMSGRGGGSRGFSRGRGGGNFSGGRGGFQKRGNFSREPAGPPDSVVGSLANKKIECGILAHYAEGDMVLKSSLSNMVPYNNAFVYLENKSAVGKVDEIFGQINDSFFSVKLNAGFTTNSFKADDKFYIDSSKLLPLERFLNPVVRKPNPNQGANKSSGKQNFQKNNRQNFQQRNSSFRGAGKFSNNHNNNNNNFSNNNNNNYNRKRPDNFSGRGRNSSSSYKKFD